MSRAPTRHCTSSLQACNSTLAFVSSCRANWIFPSAAPEAANPLTRALIRLGVTGPSSPQRPASQDSFRGVVRRGCLLRIDLAMNVITLRQMTHNMRPDRALCLPTPPTHTYTLPLSLSLSLSNTDKHTQLAHCILVIYRNVITVSPSGVSNYSPFAAYCPAHSALCFL